MKKIKLFIIESIHKYVFLEFIYRLYLQIFFPKKISHVFKPRFSGWGMATSNYVPWDINKNIFFKEFIRVDEELSSLVKTNNFALSQFQYMFPNKNTFTFLNDLRWRHYIVYTSVSLAIKKTINENVNLVECGVCDGLTIYYALKSIIFQKRKYNAYLYDAWTGMDNSILSDSEKRFEDEYNFLELKKTKENLSIFTGDSIYFNKGFIPESFAKYKKPEKINWLHIDLNSFKATINTLDHFWPEIEDGGVVLFDDYALIGYEDTKKAIDEWINEKVGELTFFQYPTGQAIIIKVI